jgi:DNA invertase Pin-like site-specific DNA recombinase
MEKYCMYLRKSRSDDDRGEKLNEAETLSRHKTALYDLAKRQGLTITKIYEEVGSAETIEKREAMKQLLEDVNNRMWTGVFVVKVDRLGRGEGADQEYILKSFKYSKTKIITPGKTFDLNDKFDYKALRFSLYLSSEEYGYITERLQDGRMFSVIEGKFPGNKAPLGYKRVKLADKRGWTLEIVPNEAEIIRLMFDLYTDGEVQADGSAKRLGTSLIARRLNDLKIPAKNGRAWKAATIRDILTNIHYTGKVRWSFRATVKSMDRGKEVSSRPRAKIGDYLVFDGLHEAIINPTVFGKAQEYMKKNPPRPISEKHKTSNPLAGIIICNNCGRRMVRRPYGSGYPDTLICAVPQCKTVSSQLHLVEACILKWLEDWLKNYKPKWKKDRIPKENTLLNVKRGSLFKLNAELAALDEQRKETHKLLERRIYTEKIFFERTNEINNEISQLSKSIASVNAEIQKDEASEKNRRVIVPTVKKLTDIYRELTSPADKNDLLKLIIEKAVYIKTVKGKRNGKLDDFKIIIYPKIPMLKHNR